jgi:predicted metal-dependent hydrolase
VGGRLFPVDVARHARARRYVLRLTPDGRLRLTVPRGASIAAGLRFAGGQQAWIAREWARHLQRVVEWQDGTPIWFRGARVALSIAGSDVSFADQFVRVDPERGRLRTAIEQHLRRLATAEFPVRANVLASERRLPVVRVRVGNQTSRWGSCSSRGAVALNWRLIQMPPEVCDYVILHELAHRVQANHSAKFWREVDALCPGWKSAERWLRTHGKELF